MPPHKPSHRRLGPLSGPQHGPQWFVSVEDDITREEFAGHLEAIGRALGASDEVDINGKVISVPESVEFVLRFERTPHGSLALVMRAEWPENGEDTYQSSRRLTVGPANGSVS
jgi:hypothetical protein